MNTGGLIERLETRPVSHFIEMSLTKQGKEQLANEMATLLTLAAFLGMILNARPDETPADIIAKMHATYRAM